MFLSFVSGVDESAATLTSWCVWLYVDLHVVCACVSWALRVSCVWVCCELCVFCMTCMVCWHRRYRLLYDVSSVVRTQVCLSLVSAVCVMSRAGFSLLTCCCRRCHASRLSAVFRFVPNGMSD